MREAISRPYVPFLDDDKTIRVKRSDGRIVVKQTHDDELRKLYAIWEMEEALGLGNPMKRQVAGVPEIKLNASASKPDTPPAPRRGIIDFDDEEPDNEATRNS